MFDDHAALLLPDAAFQFNEDAACTGKPIRIPGDPRKCATWVQGNGGETELLHVIIKLRARENKYLSDYIEHCPNPPHNTGKNN